MVKYQGISIVGIARLLLLAGIIFAIPTTHIFATVTQDDTAGTYTNDFSTVAGTASTIRSGIDVSGTGNIKLKKNDGSGLFAPTYYTTGYVITSTIMPALLAKWGTLTYTVTIPANTTLKVQILDEKNNIYSDTLLPGNTAGFTATSIDLSSLNVLQSYDPVNNLAKYARIRIRFNFTSDGSDTPAVNDFSFNWTRTQGDLTASTLSPGRSIINGNIYQNNAAASNLTSNYYTMNFATNIGAKSYTALYTDNASLYAFSQGGKDGSSNIMNGTLSSMNLDTGAIGYTTSFTGSSYTDFDLIVTANNTGYYSDAYNDVLGAIDLSNGTIKWIYQFSGGHQCHLPTIDANGVIYCLYRDSNSQNPVMYALNSDGSVKWTKAISEPGSSKIVSTNTVFDGNGNLVFGYYTYSGSYNTNNGKLLAISTTNDPNPYGTTVWSNDFGDIVRIVSDASGNIYAGSSDDIYTDAVRTKKIAKFDSSGNILWQYNLDSGYGSIEGITVRGNNVSFQYRHGYMSTSSVIDWSNINVYDEYLLNPTTGVLVRSTTRSGSISFESSVVSDLQGKAIFPGTTMSQAYILSGKFSLLDENNSERWSFRSPESSTYNPDFFSPIIGSNGRIFIEEYKYSASAYNDYSAYILSFIPWTLTPTVTGMTGGYFKPGNTASFSVTTSMLQTNLLSGGSNKLQVYIDNGDIVPLSYSSTDGDGNTVWTGSYIIPSSWSTGSHTYTVEASADGVTTDLGTHFATPATDSGNTGYTTTDTLPIDTGIDTLAEAISPKDYCKDCTSPSLVFKKASDTKSGLSSYRVRLDPEKHVSLGLSGIPSSGTNLKDHIYTDNRTYKVTYMNEEDNDPTNDRIEVYFYDLDVTPLLPGKHTWEVAAVDTLGNLGITLTDVFIDQTAPEVPTITLNGTSLVGIKEGASIRVTSKQPTLKGTIRDPFIGSSRKNPDGQTDTFDSVASGPHHLTITVAQSGGKVLFRETYLFNQKDVVVDDTYKTLSFSYPFPKPLGGGPYTVLLELSDAVGNTVHVPSFTITRTRIWGTTPTSTLVDTLQTIIPRMDFFSPEKGATMQSAIKGTLQSRTPWIIILGGFLGAFSVFLFLIGKKRKKKEEKEIS